MADLSQRELAAASGISRATVGHVESGTRDLPVRLLVRLAALAHLRLALVDDTGDQIQPMAPGAVRDRGNRRFPAHLDTRYGDEDWWHGESRYSREQPWYTFDRLRYTRDHWRVHSGIPDDHQLPRPGDSPQERRAERARRGRLRRQEEARRRREAGELPPPPEPFDCICPSQCDDLDDRTGPPVHAPHCSCRCDVA
jgi:transcriptional regulator with XRE-family HTH domain